LLTMRWGKVPDSGGRFIEGRMEGLLRGGGLERRGEEGR
jgi:hypothetical protein